MGKRQNKLKPGQDWSLSFIQERSQMAKKKTVPGYEITVQGVYISLNLDNGVKTKRFYGPEIFEFPQIVSYKEGRKEETVQTREDGSVITRNVPKIVRANVSKGNVARHLIRTYYLNDRLKASKPDFISVQTCEIFSKEKKDVESRDISDVSIKDMTASELNQFVVMSDINVIISDYHDLADKKIAVQRAAKQKKKDDIAAGKEIEEESDEDLLVDDLLT